MLLRTVTVIVAGILLHGCAPKETADQPKAVLVEGTGTYSRPITTDSELAQQFFDQGLRLTWGYYFPEAIASHQEALRHDPEHPMIWWGLALAAGPNPNSRYLGVPDDPHGAARDAILKARELIANANEYESDLVDALYVRFDKDKHPDRLDRDTAYLNAARRLAEKYPEDSEAVALFADAYMSIRRWNYWDRDGRARPGTTRVALALERVMKVRPDHPGTNHLYIHLLEASPHPERALPQADRLEALMPLAGHIVHMPSHIYVRVGRYEKAIANNIRSAAVDEEFLAAWGDIPYPTIGTYQLSARTHPSHANDFIRYAATVQGNYARAAEAARTSAAGVLEKDRLSGSGQVRTASIWVVQKIFGRWDELMASRYESEGAVYLDGMRSYTIGSAHLAGGDMAAAAAELEKLEAFARHPDAATLGARANKADSVLSIAVLGLSGEIMQARGDFAGAIAAFEQAVQLEDTFTYIEPPDWPQPMRHYLGAALLEAGRAEEAEAVYREDLAWNQNNGWSLHGLWQALEAQGKADEAAAARASYEAAWSGADTELTRSRI